MRLRQNVMYDFAQAYSTVAIKSIFKCHHHGLFIKLYKYYQEAKPCTKHPNVFIVNRFTGKTTPDGRV